MLDPIVHEIVRLHRFFEEWFTGRLPAHPEMFIACSANLAPDFLMITPDGRAIRRDDLLPALYRRHGSQPDFSIEIKNARVQRHLGPFVLATYEEWQTIGQETRGRLSSVLFHSPSTTSRPLWLHLHETWLPL